MVQGLSQVYRVDQGCSSLVFPVKLVDAFSCNHEGCYHAVIEVDAGKIAAMTEQERTQKDICSLVVLDRNHLPCQY